MTGPQGSILVPPSESSPEELHKLRYMGAVSTDKPVARYGDWRFAAVATVLVVAVVIGSLVFYSLIFGSVQVAVSDIVVTPGVCQSYGGFSSSTLSYAFVLTNTGTRDAIASLDFYADGQLVGTSWYNPVAAGHSVRLSWSVGLEECNPSGATVLLRNAIPA